MIYVFTICLCDCALQVTEETSDSSRRNHILHATSDDVPDSSTQVTENTSDSGCGKLRHRSRSTMDRRSESLSDGRVSHYLVHSSLPDCSTVCVESAGDIFELNTSLSTSLQGSCIDGISQTNETSPCMDKALPSEYHKTKTLLFPCAKCISPENASFRHSTPEDRDSAAVSQMISCNDSESMCSYKDDCPYEDIDTSVVVRNVLSWHDSMNEPSPSRSCISMDDSLFLREFNVEGSDEAEVLATCTAVSSLEQLEQEVAGVLSDCGDMEKCFGLLRRRDSLKAVAGRYSLGVADSVLAADKCARWQESIDSQIIDELSLSSSIGIARHSGLLWDDDGFDARSPSISFVPVSHRATRSLSPQPALRRQQNNFRASLGAYADVPVNMNIADGNDDVDNNASIDLAPCSVYDVNRRLSGRLQV